MKTPIVDFIEKYEQSKTVRFHMPGHKGKTFLGCEGLDITEVKGADSLYEADGIIAESEKEAARLFGTLRTLYSTEGSSQCIRAMLYLALISKEQSLKKNTQVQGQNKRPVILAARNVHKAFLYAAALIDIDVEWLWSEDEKKSLCKCDISIKQLEDTLKRLEKAGRKPAAVYVTSPNYLGEQLDIESLSKVAHRHGVLFLVDNAHGAYLHFLEKTQHPIDLGADLCCDSAHKTLPVLTGGAYLHIADGSVGEGDKKKRKEMAKYMADRSKQAMSLFGSTSPSYLTMASLDLCNHYIADGYKEKLREKIRQIDYLKKDLGEQGWKIEKTDALKLTIEVPEKMGEKISDELREKKIECEYAEENYIVFMLTVENTKEEMECLRQSLDEIAKKIHLNNLNKYKMDEEEIETCMPRGEQICSIREAIFSASETIEVKEALGRICATPTVTCPPAIPIAVAGEKIGEQAIKLFEYYGISKVDVIALA
ncbi:MAG: aminotransferase class I/II-fold pyridoxal phosphate-dependent enzyme [Lachnospiraceae bacterium]